MLRNDSDFFWFFFVLVLLPVFLIFYVTSFDYFTHLQYRLCGTPSESAYPVSKMPANYQIVNHKALVVPLCRGHEFQVINGVLQTKKARSSASSAP